MSVQQLSLIGQLSRNPRCEQGDQPCHASKMRPSGNSELYMQVLYMSPGAILHLELAGLHICKEALWHTDQDFDVNCHTPMQYYAHTCSLIVCLLEVPDPLHKHGSQYLSKHGLRNFWTSQRTKKYRISCFMFYGPSSV